MSTGNALTLAELTAATGESNHERIVEIELIFTTFQELACLDKCPNLRNLTSISGQLLKISNLTPVYQTLTRLCLCNQKISKMEGLCLPNLQQLLLQQNSIKAIEGLEGCPKLQKLWLFSNKISKIENLHHCGDLREVWLQDNLITHVTGLETLPHLHSLALAKNRIAIFSDLESLKDLVGLRDLSFVDAHFGSNPIASSEGYRDFIICQLPSLKALDGVKISSDDKQASEDKYIANRLRFSDRLEAAQREHEREILAIDSRRNRNTSQADVLRDDLLKSFQDLESIVQNGRNKIEEEFRHQTKIREENLRAFEESMDKLKVQCNRRIDQHIKDEKERAKALDAMYEIMEQRIRAEESHALFIASLQSAVNSATCFQHLADHSPDWRFVASYFIKNERDDTEKSKLKALKLMQVYRTHSIHLNSRFEKLLSQQSQSESTAESARLFFIGNRDETRWVLSDPSSFGEQDKLILFTDASLAAALHKMRLDATQNSERKDEASETSSSTQAYEFVLCRVQLGRVERSHCQCPSSWAEIEKKGEITTDDSFFKELAYETGDGKTGSIYITTKCHWDRVLPQYHLLCTNRQPGEVEDKLDDLFQDITFPAFLKSGKESGAPNSDEMDPVQVLVEFQQAADKEYQMYLFRLQQEMDPETAAQAHQLREEVKKAQETLAMLRRRVNEERSLQDMLLKNHRQSNGIKGYVQK